MLSYIGYNMAPNASRNEGKLSLLIAPTSLAQFEVMIDLDRVTKDVTKNKESTTIRRWANSPMDAKRGHRFQKDKI